MSSNKVKSFEYIVKAANSKDDLSGSRTIAQTFIADMYFKGEGVSKDLEKAYEWYLIAVKNGSKQVDLKITELEQKLTKQQIKKVQKYAGYWMPGGSTLIRENENEILQASKSQQKMKKWINRNPWYKQGGKPMNYVNSQYDLMIANGWKKEEGKTYDELDRRIIKKRLVISLSKENLIKIQPKLDLSGYGQHVLIYNKNDNWYLKSVTLSYSVNVNGSSTQQTITANIGPKKQIRQFLSSEDISAKNLSVAAATGYRLK